MQPSMRELLVSIANQFTGDQNSPHELAADYPPPPPLPPPSVFLQSGYK